ncbi:efflux RND transporter permease subunit [Desulfovibrio inopinatus]|uniref:efflux RND transporter permease subunit n=1 Tax=Desulfovibrio inopinatus TaxID=102109 RepID=UPI000414EFC5|nr:efflux RND transporter permease subunit [Desulfovibrio inopinatus]
MHTDDRNCPDTSPNKRTGPIAWMAGNSVAANILMLLLLVGGFIVANNVKQEVFPEFSTDMVRIIIAYPGAGPEEVESGVVLAVEEAIQGLEGIKKIESTASEGSAVITVEALTGADVTLLWQDIKAEVDRITTFPEEIEEPQVAIAERHREVLSFALSGDTSERALREKAEQIRDQLLLNSNITQVELSGVRDYEIIVEVPHSVLRRYGVTLNDVANRIANNSVELGGGSLKTAGGEVLLRVDDKRETGRGYSQLPLLTGEDGSRIHLDDVATVKDDFEDTDSWATFNGKPAIMIEVYRVGDQTPIQVADAARKVADQVNQELPKGLHLDVLRDSSEVYRQRADLLLSNAYTGLALVFVCLALFLEIRLAFWVSLGIPISFLGSFLILPAFGFSINMITMFAFLVTLGIVVDDAIVVGENVYHHRSLGKSRLQAAIDGSREVAMPVVFSVLTNVIAFLPLYFVPGIMGKVFRTIPVVVVGVFTISLIESLFILPAHLGHGDPRPMPGPLAWLGRKQTQFSEGVESFIANRFAPLLRWCLNQRYLVISIGIAILITTVSYVASGRMGIVLFSKIESDYAYVEAELPYGSATERVRTVQNKLVAAAEKVVKESGGEALSRGIFSVVDENVVKARIFLTPPEERPFGTAEITRRWQQATGIIPGLETISFESDRGGPGSGKGLSVQLSHRNRDQLEAAGEDLAAQISKYSGVSDIYDGSARGKRQYDVSLLPAGERMGLTSREIGNQIRASFYGAEALRQQRGRNEVTVRVRLPENERTTESTLEDLVLTTPSGGEIYLRDAAKLTPSQAYTSIMRTDSRRTITVTANVRPQSQAENIINSMKKDILPELMRKYPGLNFSFGGRQADLRESLQSLKTGFFLALLAIYAFLAIPFRNYFQPLIIMFCIPFGIIGAIFGHLAMGYSLSLMSMFGIIALSGVVVNDSLVLIDFSNRRRLEGLTALEAILDSGRQRFRPILLTTLTTFGGLAPMIFETSRQARFLIPMAISLGFGILFATFITLLLVPCLYIVQEDIHNLFTSSKPAANVKLKNIEQV